MVAAAPGARASHHERLIASRRDHETCHVVGTDHVYGLRIPVRCGVKFNDLLQTMVVSPRNIGIE